MVRARLHGARFGELEFVHGATNAAAQSDACPFRQLRQVARLGAKSTIEFFARIRAPEKSSATALPHRLPRVTIAAQRGRLCD